MKNIEKTWQALYDNVKAVRKIVSDDNLPIDTRNNIAVRFVTDLKNIEDMTDLGILSSTRDFKYRDVVPNTSELEFNQRKNHVLDIYELMVDLGFSLGKLVDTSKF